MRMEGNHQFFHWKRSDAKARNIIGKNLNNLQLVHITHTKTAKIIMQAPKEVFGKTGLRDQTTLIKDLWSLKLRGKGDCKTHLTKLTTITENLAWLAHRKSKDWIFTQICLWNIWSICISNVCLEKLQLWTNCCCSLNGMYSDHRSWTTWVELQGWKQELHITQKMGST